MQQNVQYKRFFIQPHAFFLNLGVYIYLKLLLSSTYLAYIQYS